MFAVQGMYITKLMVHLGRAFAAGMVYVALSRCVSLNSLQVSLCVKAYTDQASCCCTSLLVAVDGQSVAFEALVVSCAIQGVT